MEKDGIISLYISFKEDSKGWLTLQRQTFTQFVTIILAVFGVSVAASYQFIDKGWLLLAVVLGPIVNIVLCLVAMKACDRSYQRFLEHETVANKLYSLLDADNNIDSRVEADKNIYPNDSHLLPDRWTTTIESYRSSATFVKDFMNKGINRFVRMTFWILVVANLLVGIGITARAVDLRDPNVVQRSAFDFMS